MKHRRWAILAACLGGGALALQTGIPFFGPLDASAPISYFIGPGEGVPGFRPGDATLAEWALGAWERAAGGPLRFRPAPEREALLRVRWISAADGRYGEMRPILAAGKRGAEIFVHPATDALGEEIAREARRDPLFREAIVYLTCLHELGHGLGLDHTDQYADIMYFFGHGGDIKAYFRRYRRQIKTRDDIQRRSGLSEADMRRVRQLYAGR